MMFKRGCVATVCGLGVGWLSLLVIYQHHSTQLITTSEREELNPVVNIKNCFSSALSQHGEIFHERPALFLHDTSTFTISLLGVPGDENNWNTNLSRDYHWKGSAPTLIFVGILFQQASQHGFDVSRSTTALIDVGANMGQEVIVAGLYTYKATTFEILPHSAKTVEFNLAANCVSSDLITIVNAGASDKSGPMMLDLSGFSPGKKAVNVPGAEYEAYVWSLDDYFFEQDTQMLASRPLLFKLDCEGCEPSTLKGSQKLLKDYPPHFILLEFRAHYPGYIEEVTKLMLDLHYSRAYVITDSDALLRGDQISGKESFFKNDLKSKLWSLDDGPCICDILLVHRDAIEVGLF